MTCTKIPKGYLCSFDGEPDLRGLNRNTRLGREEEVVRKVRMDGKFSVFWATESQKRAWAIERLLEAGVLMHVLPESAFPYNAFRVNEEKWEARKQIGGDHA
jgi:hypothetical protein